MRLPQTARQIKRLLGRRMDEPALQQEAAEHFTFPVVEGPDGRAAVEVRYAGKKQVVTAVHLASMVLKRALSIAQRANPRAAAADVVLSIPAYFTAPQRAALVDACKLAGVHCLRLLPEGTATALGYGFFRNARNEFAAGPQRVLFVDTGYSHTTATVVTFEAGAAKVDAVAWDEEAGGRNMDAAVGRLLASRFQSKHSSVGKVWEDKKVRLKLLTAAEKVRMTMTPYGVNQAKANSECLVDDFDLAETVELQEMEDALEPVAKRVDAVVRRVLAQVGGVDKDAPYKSFAGIEVVGGASRVRLIKRTIATSLGMPLDEATAHGLQTSVNADECVAKGCALCCAMVSPLFRVQEYNVVDRVVLPVRLRWGAVGSVEQTPKDCGAESSEEKQVVMVFPAGSPMPNEQRVTFREGGAFEVVAEYDPREVAMALRAGAGVGLGEEGDGAAAGGGGGDGEEASSSEAATVSMSDSVAASQLLALQDFQIARFRIDVPQSEVDEAVANQKKLDEMDGTASGAGADAAKEGASEFLPKIRVEFALTDHGLVTVDAASLAKPKVPEAPAPAPAAAADAEATNGTASAGSAEGGAGQDGQKKESEQDGQAKMDGAEGAQADAVGAGGDSQPESGSAAGAETADAAPDAPAASEGSEPKPESDGASPAAAAEQDESSSAAPAPAAPPAAAPAAGADAAAVPRKRKVTRVPVATRTQTVSGALDKAGFEALSAREAEMARLDEAVRFRTAKRNELEKYVYALRGDLRGKLKEFVEDGEADEIRDLLDEEEDWVCYGDGEDAELEELEEHLGKLHARGKPIEQRWYNAQHIADAGATLMSLVERYRAVAASADEAYAHLEESERDTLRSAAKGAEAWFRDLQGEQGKLDPTKDPVLKVSDVRARTQAIRDECERIVNKPKPKPKPVPVPEEEQKPAGAGEADGAAASGAGESSDAPQGETEQKEGEDAKESAESPAGDAEPTEETDGAKSVPAAEEADAAQPAMDGEEAKADGDAEGKQE